jgi:hypothetical protein
VDVGNSKRASVPAHCPPGAFETDPNKIAAAIASLPAVLNAPSRKADLPPSPGFGRLPMVSPAKPAVG